MRIILYSIFFWAWTVHVYAQTETPDTTLNAVVQLGEVVVVDQAPEETSLNFYQTTQQNGVEKIMERMPGISMIRRGNFAPDLVLRGMRNGQVSITVDGMQIFGACTDRMDPITSYVETNNLKSISEHSDQSDGGCHSANLAGGVNLEVKQPLFGDGWTGSVSTGYGSNGNAFNSLLNLSYGSKQLAANFNAVYRRQQNYTDGNNKLIEYSQFEKINLSGNLRYRLFPNQILRLDFILDNAYNVGYAALPMDVAFAKAKIFGLGYHRYGNGVLKEINAKAYYNFIDHAMDDSQRPDVPIRMDMPGTSETWGMYAEGKLKEMGNHNLFGKLEAFSNFRHAEMTMYPPTTDEPPMYMVTWPDVRKSSFNTFFADDWNLATKHGLHVSMRFQADFNDITSEEGKKFLVPFGYNGATQYLLPAFTTTYTFKPNPFHQLFLKGGYTSRGPSTTEQFGFYLFNAYDGYDYIGKPDISKESAFQFSLGYNLNKNKINVRAEGYTYFIDDYILGITNPDYDAMTIGANGVRVFENIPHAAIAGISATLNATLNPWFFLMAKVDFTRGIMQSENLPLISPLNGIISFKVKKAGWEAVLETELAAEQNLVNANYGDMVTPGYVVNHVRLLKQFALKKSLLHVETGIENILNVAYRNHLDWGGILRPGRNIYVQLKYSF